MAHVEIKSNLKLGLREILDGISKLDAKDIELFMQEVAGILAKKQKKASKESSLIKKIKSIYPTKLSKRYQALRLKMTNQVLTDTEQKELLTLTNQFETLDAQRLQYLLQLTEIRKQPLDILLKEFAPTHA
ncbi:MAG: hypothetical protein AB8G86_22665 [Saprospiraceae bacterium]